MPWKMLTSVPSIRLDMSLYTKTVVPDMPVFPFTERGMTIWLLNPEPRDTLTTQLGEAFGLSTGRLGANLRQQSRALVGQPFKIPNISDPVTSGGGGGIGL